MRGSASAPDDLMSFPTFLFYAFSAILVFAALRVVTTRNPVHAALWLVLAFFTAAAHWLMLGAEFLAIALVLVYVGAVMVLFLFVVMMLDVNFDNLRDQFRSYIPFAAAIGALVLIEMALVLLGSHLRPGVGAGGGTGSGSNTRALGLVLYTEYVYAFEIAAVVLLVAIIAAIALTHRQRRATKYQNPGEQVKVRARDRLRILKVPAEKRDR
jgi:NADH-quinone oxidoreductase subunit J